ncbi:methionyl-tRNA formyltransferase [Lusitaniella coriacea]|uniref:methionyl-tRNA formyltransferase n=1 Tax=Lusitaniella coriacea TaxID=1983105 RepID=UPI003CF8BE1B
MENPELPQKFIVVASKSWNRQVFEKTICHYPGEWHFVRFREELTFETIQSLAPRYLFFLHWSWKVPEEIVDNYECVCFHMTDVPYGRGGSPLQNLILRGHQQTKLTALRMTEEFDAGPVYCQENLCLAGNAEEIYIRATALAAQMIQHIVEKQPIPVAQTGEIVVFKRRKPEESEIPELSSLSALYDFLRMLDAEGYPKAFLNYEGFRYEFSRAALYNGRIVADVTIVPSKETNS